MCWKTAICLKYKKNKSNYSYCGTFEKIVEYGENFKFFFYSLLRARISCVMWIGAVNIYLTEFLLQMNMANFVKKVYLFCLSTGGRFAWKLVFALENSDLFEV